MNRLSKILLAIIIILMIVLSFVTFKYFKLRDTVYEYLGNYEFTYNTNSEQKPEN